MTSAWIVIPTYNEAENLRSLLDAVRAAMADGTAGVVSMFLVVDDNSPDGTGAIADQLANRHSDVQALHRRSKTGLAGAYVAGFQHALAAGADFVFEMDADFSHDPADLPRLIEAARHGADVVLGSRYVPGGGVDGWSKNRQLLSRAGGFYARAVLGSSIRDLTCGFKGFRADALRAIGLDAFTADGYAFQVETIFRAEREGLRIEELPIVFHERRAGRSKLSLGIALEAIWRIPAMRLTQRAGRPTMTASGAHSRASRSSSPPQAPASDSAAVAAAATSPTPAWSATSARPSPTSNANRRTTRFPVVRAGVAARSSSRSTPRDRHYPTYTDERAHTQAQTRDPKSRA